MTDSALIATLGALFDNGRFARLRVEGDSMHPTIRSGEVVILDRPDVIRRGDIVLYDATRGLTAHRVHRVEEQGLLVRGDAAARREIEIVPPTKVLGRAIAVERRGNERFLRGPFRRNMDLARAAASRLYRWLMGDRVTLDSFHEEFRDLLARILEGKIPDWPSEWASRISSFLRYVESHGMLPLLHWHASTTPSFQAWPREIRETVRTVAIGTAAGEARRTAELVRMLDRFASDGIETILLKGAAVAQLFYEESWLRPMADVDMLISRSQLATTRETLRSLEYVERLSAGDGTHTQLTFVREAGGTRHVLDIHWALSNTPALRDVLTWDEAIRDSIKIPGLSNARSLSPAHLLLHASVHRVGHHGCSNRLIWLVDIHALWQRLDNREREMFWGLAAAKGVRRICSDSILASERWFSHESLEDPAAPYLAPELLERHEASAALLSAPTRRAGRVFVELSTIEGWRQRLRWLVSQLFPSPRFMLSRDHPHSLLELPWLYLVRLVRAPARLARKSAVTDPNSGAGSDRR